MDGSQPINAYLSGNFAPVHSEDDFELDVVGEIPPALHGTLYRNGPNPQFEPLDDYHWFGGDGMVHAFVLEGGKARYRNRYVYARPSIRPNTPPVAPCSAHSEIQ